MFGAQLRKDVVRRRVIPQHAQQFRLGAQARAGHKGRRNQSAALHTVLAHRRCVAPRNRGRDHDVIETTDARPDNTDRLVLYVRAFHNGRQYCRAERARQAGNEHKMIEE